MKRENHVFYLLILILAVASVFFSPIYNWDIDHEMYFGSRLLAGDLIWTKEFHDKLPFVPFIFMIPAYFKGVYVFKLISLSSIFVFCAFLIFFAKKIFSEKYGGNERALFAALVFFVFLFVSHDSIGTINCVAASFYGISLSLILYDNFSNGLQTRIDKFLVLLSGTCFGAMAISIRPYYIAALGMTIISAIMLGEHNGPHKSRLLDARKCLKIFTWTFFIGVWGGIFNVLPYVLTGQLSAFRDGLAMLGSHINPLPALHDFLSDVWKIPDVLLWGSWFFMVLAMFSIKKKNMRIVSTREYKVFWISNLSALAMLFYVLSEHYWPHYMQLFIANYSISLVSLLFLLKKPGDIQVPWGRARTVKARILLRIFLSVLSVLLLLGLVRDVVVAKRVRHTDVPNWSSTYYNWKEDLFHDYVVKSYPSTRPSFLFPDDMKAHWLLDEPRHGFPHAANTMQIFRGWWENITLRSSHFFVMSNGVQYCEKIRSNGPDLIVIQPNSFLLPCMTSAASGYQLETTMEKPIGKIMVFRRVVQP